MSLVHEPLKPAEHEPPLEHCCRYCGNQFIRKPTGGIHRYCSELCRSRAQRRRQGAKPKNLVSHGEIRQAIELRGRGLFDYEIGKQLGVSRSRVGTILDAARRQGFQVPKSPYEQRGITKPQYRLEDRGYGTPCWIWQLHIDKEGYGRYHGDGESLAHRVYFRQHFGSSIEGYDLHHKCEQKACVNPNHLELLNRRDHMVAHDLWARRLVIQDPPTIRRIRYRAECGEPFERLAREYGVSPQTITRIYRREGGYASVD